MYILKKSQVEGTKNSEYFDKIMSKRYKDTSYSIVKDSIGKTWRIFLIDDTIEDTTLVRVAGRDSKTECIDAIHSGELKDYYVYLMEKGKFAISLFEKLGI